MVGLARNLVGAGQWGEALSVVEGLKMMWESTSHPSANGSQPPNGLLQPVLEEPPDNWESTSTASGTAPKSSAAVPLSQLKAFASLPSQLQILTLEIAASLTTDVVGVLKVDLVQRVHGSRDPAQASSHTELRDRLLVVVALTVVVDAVCGVLTFALEHDVRGTAIHNLGDALFFSTTQLLSVSSSLANPLSPAGKVLDVLMELYAITIVAGLAGMAGAFLHRHSREQRAA